MNKEKSEEYKNLIKGALSSRKMKVSLYIVAVLWVAVATQIAVNYFFMESFQITEAFVKTDTEEQSSSVEIVAEYEGDFLSEEEKKEIIYTLADSIGLVIDKEIAVTREDGRTEFYFEKKAISAETMIKVISLERPDDDAIKVNHYILARLNIQKSIHEIERYKELLRDALQQLGINEKQITMQYVGNYEGELSQTEKEEIVSHMVNDLQGEIAFEYNEDGVYTVYGYTGHINEYILSLGSKINIHIAVTYDEQLDKTKLYLASPIINQSW